MKLNNLVVNINIDDAGRYYVRFQVLFKIGNSVVVSIAQTGICWNIRSRFNSVNRIHKRCLPTTFILTLPLQFWEPSSQTVPLQQLSSSTCHFNSGKSKKDVILALSLTLTLKLNPELNLTRDLNLNRTPTPTPTHCDSLLRK